MSGGTNKFDYANFAATATRLISRYGQESVTWRQHRDGVPPDVDEPWKPGASSDTDFLVDMVFIPEKTITRHTRFRRINDGKEEVTPQGMLIGLMAQQTDFTPVLKDAVVRDGVQLRVAYLDRLNPDGTDLLWTVGLIT